MSRPVTHDPIVATFHELVNMSGASLDAWLKTAESRSVGWADDASDESVGHASGRHIVRILRKHRDDYTDADIEHMHKVVGYIKRHLAQGGPKTDKAHSRWTYSLKNWGHDPLHPRRS